MKQDNKTFVKNYERTKSYKRKGKDVKLATIIDDVYFRFSVTESSMPDYLNQVHPWLYYNYLIDWTNVPDTYLPTGMTGKQFGDKLISEWRKECWKKKLANVGFLNVFSSFEELCDMTDDILEGKQFNKDISVDRLEEMLYERKQAIIDKEVSDRQAKEDELNAEIEEAQLDADIKKLQQKKDELRKTRAANEAERVRINNKIMATKEGGPWTADVSKMMTPKKDNNPMAKVTNKPASTKLADVMPDIPQTDGVTIDELLKCLFLKCKNTFVECSIDMYYTDDSTPYVVKLHRIGVPTDNGHEPLPYIETETSKRYINDREVKYNAMHFRSNSFVKSLDMANTWVDKAITAKEQYESKAKLKEEIQSQIAEQMKQIQALQEKLNSL